MRVTGRTNSTLKLLGSNPLTRPAHPAGLKLSDTVHRRKPSFAKRQSLTAKIWLCGASFPKSLLQIDVLAPTLRGTLNEGSLVARLPHAISTKRQKDKQARDECRNGALPAFPGQHIAYISHPNHPRDVFVFVFKYPFPPTLLNLQSSAQSS